MMLLINNAIPYSAIALNQLSGNQDDRDNNQNQKHTESNQRLFAILASRAIISG